MIRYIIVAAVALLVGIIAVVACRGPQYIDDGRDNVTAQGADLPKERYTVFFRWGVAVHTDDVVFGEDTITVEGLEHPRTDAIVRDNTNPNKIRDQPARDLR